MEKNNSEIKELKDILIGFIKEQKKFNEEQKVFNDKFEKKIDKVQYFLEETIATNTKMFFEEQIEMKTEMREIEGEIKSLKNDLIELTLKVNNVFNSGLVN